MSRNRGKIGKHREAILHRISRIFFSFFRPSNAERLPLGGRLPPGGLFPAVVSRVITVAQDGVQ
jgi:hypothetical protein